MHLFIISRNWMKVSIKTYLTIIWQFLDIKIWIWSFVTATWLWLMAMTTSGGSKKEWGFSGSGEPIECHLLGWIGLVRPQLKLWSPVCKDDRSNRSFSVVHYTLTFLVFLRGCHYFWSFLQSQEIAVISFVESRHFNTWLFPRIVNAKRSLSCFSSVSVKMTPLLHLGCRP